MPVPTQPKMTGSVRASSSVMPREAKRTSERATAAFMFMNWGCPEPERTTSAAFSR